MSFQTELEFASLSHTGLVRAHNEDAVEVRADAGIAILADGMGGYNAGEVASRMCVEVVSQYLQQKQQAAWSSILPRGTSSAARWINDAITLANTRVLEAANQHVEYVGMGTTVVVALFHQDKMLIGHGGDSRAYRLRGSEMVQITHDHSVLQAQIDAGLISKENAQFSPIKNLITRAVGAQSDIEIEVHDHHVEVGDVFLLCSDGLSDMVGATELEQILLSHVSEIQQGCQALVDVANKHGGRDNISVVLVKVHSIQQRSLMGQIFST